MKILILLFILPASTYAVKFSPTNYVVDPEGCVPCQLSKMGINAKGGSAIKNEDSNLTKSELLEGSPAIPDTKKGASDINNGNNQPRAPASK